MQGHLKMKSKAKEKKENIWPEKWLLTIGSREILKELLAVYKYRTTTTTK